MDQNINMKQKIRKCFHFRSFWAYEWQPEKTFHMVILRLYKALKSTDFDQIGILFSSPLQGKV